MSREEEIENEARRDSYNGDENKEFLKLVIEIGQDFLSEYFFNNFDYVVQSQEFKNIDELLEKYQKYMERHITETTETIKLSQKKSSKIN